MNDGTSTEDNGTTPLNVCFYAPVDDSTKLRHVGFYKQDIDALEALGHRVTIATKWKEIPWTSDVYFIWWWTWAFIPLIKAILTRKKTIITGTFNLKWGSGDYYHRPIRQRILLRASLRLADLNLFVSHHELDPILANKWTQHAMYSPHCVDTNLYAPSGAQRKIGELLTIGWLREENAIRKGMPDLIRALPFVRAQHPNVRLAIVGEHDSGFPTLQRLAADLGVADLVTFPGKVDEDTKIRLLQECSVYVQPSQYEGFGLAILEAMSCGAPVVTRRVGAVPEVVGNAGIYVEHDSQSLAEGIIAVLDSDTVAAEMGIVARQRAQEHFRLERRRDDISTALSRVLESNNE